MFPLGWGASSYKDPQSSLCVRIPCKAFSRWQMLGSTLGRLMQLVQAPLSLKVPRWHQGAAKRQDCSSENWRWVEVQWTGTCKRLNPWVHDDAHRSAPAQSRNHWWSWVLANQGRESSTGWIFLTKLDTKAIKRLMKESLSKEESNEWKRGDWQN